MVNFVEIMALVAVVIVVEITSLVVVVNVVKITCFMVVVNVVKITGLVVNNVQSSGKCSKNGEFCCCGQCGQNEGV